MTKQFRAFVCAALLLLAGGGARLTHAQVLPDADDPPVKYAQAGMGFLKIDVGARIAGMAGTHAGATGDAAAMFTNPAGLAQLQGFDAMSTVTNWIADIKHYGVGVAFRAGNFGTFGASLVAMEYGEFQRTSVYTGDDPELRLQGYIDEGTFKVQEFAVGLSYAKQITGQFSVGGQLRYARQDLGSALIVDRLRETNIEVDNRVNNFVADFGTLFYPGFRDLRFGVSVRNFSNQADYYNQRFELPLTLDFGAAMDLLSLTSGMGDDNKLTLAVDWLHPRDFSERLHVGLEYGFQDLIFLRGGYKFNYDEESFSAGVGVKAGLSGLKLRGDYAYSAFGEFFNQVHRVTLGISLD